MNRYRSPLITAWVVVAAACAGSESTAPGLRAIAAHVVVVAGDSQAGQVHTQLPAVISVRVLDDAQRPIRGHAVSWRIVKGGGSVFAGFGITDSTGTARERWTLGDTAGVQELEARAIDSAGTPVVFARVTATAMPGPLHVHGWSGRRFFVWLDSTATLPLLAHDRYGNLVSLPPPIVAAYDTARWGAHAGRTFRPRDLGVVRFVAAPRFDTLEVYVLRGPAVRWQSNTASGTATFTGIDSSQAPLCTPDWCGRAVYAGMEYILHTWDTLTTRQVRFNGAWLNPSRADSSAWHYNLGGGDTLRVLR